MITQSFSLLYGIEHDGILHREGELRLPVLTDLEETLESLPPDACDARIARHIWARTITRLGDIPREQITPELLGTAVDNDFGILREAENTLRKKLLPPSEASC